MESVDCAHVSSGPFPFAKKLSKDVCFLLIFASLRVYFLSSSSCRGDSGTGGREVEKSFSNQKVASSIPCRSVLEQGTEPLIVQCAISVNVKCVYILVSRFG